MIGSLKSVGCNFELKNLTPPHIEYADRLHIACIVPGRAPTLYFSSFRLFPNQLQNVN